MAELSKDVSHEYERGLLVKVLVDWRLDWMPFHELRMQTAALLGYRLSEQQIRFHLNYLVQGGYIETKQLRAGRAEIELTAIRATSKSVDLLEGRVEPDPGIAF